MIRVLGGIFALIALAMAGTAGAWAWLSWQSAQPGPLQEETVVLVPRGLGVTSISELLESEGVIENRWIFTIWSRLSDDGRSLKAGEYRFSERATEREVLSALREGRTVRHIVTVAEGRTSREITDQLKQDDRLSGEIDVVPAEGILLPESYSITRGDARQAVLDRMTAAMAATLEELWEERADDLPFDTAEEAVTLASVIEKETGVAGERGLVASVFVNRLRRGMPLQSDPTVIYALTEGEGPLGRQLFRSDWEVDHPYNTYQNNGLPPGPIANPGIDSIRAALDPDESDYIYFVADGTGGHAFAQTLEEHNRNVARWRQIRDAANHGAASD